MGRGIRMAGLGVAGASDAGTAAVVIPVAETGVAGTILARWDTAAISLNRGGAHEQCRCRRRHWRSGQALGDFCNNRDGHGTLWQSAAETCGKAVSPRYQPGSPWKCCGFAGRIPATERHQQTAARAPCGPCRRLCSLSRSAATGLSKVRSHADQFPGL
jgi:hypothetical protein